MRILKAPLYIFCFAVPCALAQPHVHGKGTVFIAQDKNVWQMQFTLPAADVFGFEHKPESKSQWDEVTAKVSQLHRSSELLKVPSMCQHVDSQIDIPNEFATKHNHHSHHDEHEHQDDHKDGHHDGHGKADKHAHEEHDTHHDVGVTLTYQCDEDIAQLELVIFDNFLSVSTLDAIWSIDSGQGQTEVSAAAPVVRF